MSELLSLCNAFALQGTAIACEPFGNGHINDTYLVQTDAGMRYVLQRMNHNVFQNIQALMHNLQLVTAYLQRTRPNDVNLVVIPARTGESYLTVAGNHYRMVNYLSGGVCLDAPRNDDDLYQSAYAFGQFQRALADFPAQDLLETIPQFHDTPHRYAQFDEALAKDAAGRAALCRAEIAFALARRADANRNQALQQAGQLPLRVTHNDTKLNNVLLSEQTGKPLCVIDLDTVMPGLAGNDFGDAVRFAASSAAEDEPDLDKVHFLPQRYLALARGFLQACGDTLTPAEAEALPWCARLMALEQGVRFLTDYLQGDTYYRTHHPQQNLHRARTQFRLVAEMEQHFDWMTRQVMDLYAK